MRMDKEGTVTKGVSTIMTKAAASILSADLANLQQDCTRLLNAGVDLYTLM